VNARHVAGGGHHAALAATDDDRLVGECRIVPLFDRGVEGVAIDMGECQVVEFAVIDEARGAAGAAPARFSFLLGKAVATETGHGVGSGCHVWNKY
jgi:hypothetical protein